jgi:predicted Zn-dependent protease
VEEEVALGREVSAKIVAGIPVLRNEPLTRYVNYVGATVAAQSERKDIQYHFAVLDSDEINAFSTPGGFVFITRAALMLCEDESELAGVLAHEVGHITGKYIVHTIEHDKEKSAGISEASNYVPGSPYIQGLAKNVLTNIFTGGLPPQDEFEADQHGIQYAHNAGYPADGLKRFLAQLEIATTQKSAQTTITSTHPPVKDRITRIDDLIGKQQWQDADRPQLADRYTTMTAGLKPKAAL